MSLRRRSLGLLGALAIGVAACGGSASPTPAPSTAGRGETPAPSASAARPARPTSSSRSTASRPTSRTRTRTCRPAGSSACCTTASTRSTTSSRSVPDLAADYAGHERGRPDLDGQAQAGHQVPRRHRAQGLGRRVHLQARPVEELHLHPGRLLQHPGQRRVASTAPSTTRRSSSCSSRSSPRSRSPASASSIVPEKAVRDSFGRLPGVHRRRRPGRGQGPRRQDRQGRQRRQACAVETPPDVVRLRDLRRPRWSRS